MSLNKTDMILFSIGGCEVSVASEFEHAERVVGDVALLHDIAAGRLDEQRVRQAAEILLEHKRDELPSVSVAVAARLLQVSRTTVEAWRQAAILGPATARRRRHEVTTESLVRLHALLDELRRLGRDRELRDYVWWSAQDAADYADAKLAEALRQLRAGELGEEYVPAEEDLAWARRELDDPPRERR
jgi:transposase-like protein